VGIAIPFFFLSLLFFIQHVSGIENGIIGFGISLYQGICCQSCHNSISSLYLSCTTFSEGDDMSMDSRTSLSKKMLLKGLNVLSGAHVAPTPLCKSWTPLMIKAKTPKP
jgi:hypothetical protein